MNKREAGNEYEKFSELYVYMIRFSEPAFSREVLFQNMPRIFCWFIKNFNPFCCIRWKTCLQFVELFVKMSRTFPTLYRSVINKYNGIYSFVHTFDNFINYSLIHTQYCLSNAYRKVRKTFPSYVVCDGVLCQSIFYELKKVLDWIYIWAPPCVDRA